jgi:hypothetical protein
MQADLSELEFYRITELAECIVVYQAILSIPKIRLIRVQTKFLPIPNPFYFIAGTAAAALYGFVLLAETIGKRYAVNPAIPAQ